MGSPAIFKGRRTKLLTANGLELSNNAVVDNDGLRNYIANGHAEVSTVGWATYADAAGPEPVNGTGGSPVITWTRSTSSPLRGQASFLLTKDAANRQGEGVSYDFKIDRADLSKPLQISFDYEIGSGTFAAGDITVWLYRIDAPAALIQPTMYQLDGVVVGQQYQFKGEFQADADADDYRLILHIASTSASAYTLKVDNVLVGPSSQIAGSIVTDWVDFTPTGSIGSGVTYAGKYRRVGPDLELNYRLTFTGAPTFTSLELDLPPGMSIDTAKALAISTGKTTKVGSGKLLYLSGPNTYLADVWVTSSDPTILQTSYFLDNALGVADFTNDITNAAPFSVGATDVMQFSARVPIVGWGATATLGQDAATRVAAVSLTYNSGPQVITTGSFQTITWDTVVKDTHGAWNSGTKQITVPVSGWYTAYSMVEYAASIAGSDRRVSLFVNGVEGPTLSYLPPAFASTVTQQGSATVYLEAGDLVDPRFRQDSGGNLNIALSGPTVNHFELVRMSGPAQVAASEVVAARYTTSAGQSIPDATPTIVDFGTKDFDTHNAVTTGGAWKFTAPAPGVYEIGAIAAFVGNGSGGRETYVYKNNALHSFLHSYPGNPSVFGTYGAALVKMNAGDFVDVRVLQSSGGALALEATPELHYVTIKKVQ